ncbi:unnamed protein product [Acanthosepion pharaonis]|uniref:Resistance to inhibitors of cholinesterase protein 3 N-terminal domain-containing protein n=1 Tax=Acanthosepion pharaonis TaxID=158019 RepID=A0A812D449_ACAPH|nr:unnamed protein product [Sepia pharaonis]
MAPKPVENDILANIPPPRAAVNMERGRPGDDIRQMRPGHHPGLRAASEMRAQQQQAGSGRGMMGIVLPMYAVGIVLYLVYTLVKVFSKRSEPEPREKDPLAQLRNFKYDDRKGKFTFGEDFDPDDDFRDYLRKKHKQQELEELINKADDRHITELEMRQLQQRLEETESQMTRILQAMQSVQQHVSGVVDRASANSNIHECAQTSNDETKENPNVHEEKCPEISENEDKHCEKCENSNVVPSDSNPDLESYEVLATNSNGSEASSDYSLLNENGGSRNSPEVESIFASSFFCLPLLFSFPVFLSLIL